VLVSFGGEEKSDGRVSIQPRAVLSGGVSLAGLVGSDKGKILRRFGSRRICGVTGRGDLAIATSRLHAVERGMPKFTRSLVNGALL